MVLFLVALLGVFIWWVSSNKSPYEIKVTSIVRSIPAYPNSVSYKARFTSGFPDSKEHGVIEFKTDDSCIQVNSFYHNILLKESWNELDTLSNEPKETDGSAGYEKTMEATKYNLSVICQTRTVNEKGQPITPGKTKNVLLSLY